MGDKARDWTIEKYEGFCMAVKESGRIVLPVVDYLTDPPEGRKLVIRHDVDISGKKTLQMAELEKKFSFRTSYYYRKIKKTFSPQIMRAVAQLGHEVGYHYEVLDKAKGDIKKAKNIFEKELKEFRSTVSVKTISMHGNPLTPWDNRDFWQYYDLSDFDLVGECYLSFDANKIIYLSDTGRTWEEGRHNIKDFLIGEKRLEQPDLRTTDDLFEFLKRSPQDVYLLIHPERWSVNFKDYVVQAVRDWLGCLAKDILTRLKKKR
jgi:hypothetical protein